MELRRSGSTGRPKIHIGSKKKIAFVCSGGATKAGAFHLGVALALQEQGFKFVGGLQSRDGAESRVHQPMEISTYVGSSAGSIISAYLAAGYSLDNIFNSFTGREPMDPSDVHPKVLPRLTYPTMFRLRPGIAREQFSQLMQVGRLFQQFVRGDWEALLQRGMLRMQGLFSTAGIEEFLRKEVLPSNRFHDYAADLFVVATQLNHSRKVVFGKYRYQPPPHDLTCQYDNDVGISDACAASGSVPFVYAPYPIQNKEGRQVFYIDGEIRDTLSSHVAVDNGADLVIASHTHQPYHYNKQIGSLTEHGLPSILVQSIYLVIEQKVNNYIHNKTTQRQAILAVERYCKEQGLDPTHQKRILEILESELHHRRDVDTIYIHPSPDDSTMFFGEHFSLSPRKLSDIVKSGFKATIEKLRHYEFEDRPSGRQKPKAVDLARSSQ
ncbi:MAG: patatin-like phospholipase family protein [Oligoflexia bacterium]|jgi:predicted acylesterase/phospholipase RssA